MGMSLPMLEAMMTSIRTDEWDRSWGVTFVVIFESTEYGTCSGSVLSVIHFHGHCSSYPTGPAGAMLLTLDDDLMCSISRAFLIATKSVIRSRRTCPHDRKINSSWPQPVIDPSIITLHLVPQHNTSTTSTDSSLHDLAFFG